MPCYPAKDKKGRSRFRFDFSRVINGQQIRRSKLLPIGYSQAQADAWSRAEETRLYGQATGNAPEELRPLLSKAVELYIEWHCPDLRDGVHIAQELAHLDSYIRGRSTWDIGEVGKEYAKTNCDRLAPATIRNRLSYLKSAVRWSAEEKNYGKRAAALELKLKTPNNIRTDRLDEAGVHKLCKHVWKVTKRDPQDTIGRQTAALTRIAFYSGLRSRAEAHALTQDASVVLVDGKPWLQCGKTKNGDPHMIPVHPKIKADIQLLPFTWSYQTLYDRFKLAAAAIGKPGLWVYDMRRSLASEVLNRTGGNLKAVQEVLNHRSYQASLRYAFLDPGNKAALIMGIGKKSTKKRVA
jgi:integrase